MTITNPWKEAKLFRRAFENACAKVEHLEGCNEGLKAQIAALEKLNAGYEGLVTAHEDRTKTFADLARARNFGIDAELADVGL